MRGVSFLRRVPTFCLSVVAVLFVHFTFQKASIFSFSPLRKGKPDRDWLRSDVQDQLNLNATQMENLRDLNSKNAYIPTKTGRNKTGALKKTLVKDKKSEQKKTNEDSVERRRLEIEKNETRYFTPRIEKVNPIEAEFIINGAQICSADAKYMKILIIVPCTPSHYSERDAIRSTYGSYSKRTFKIEHTAVEVTVRLLFLVGKDVKMESDRFIRNESITHGDIVYADFIDSYRNLTRKMLIALKWVSDYCNYTDFVLKVDEDVFVNIPQLAKELHSRPYGREGAVYGHLQVRSMVERGGRWRVSNDEFPFIHYPTYALGASYVISGNIIPRMFMISEYFPHIPIEDVFVTGCLAKIVGAKVIAVPGFTEGDEHMWNPCKFSKNKRISAHNLTAAIMFKYWKACNSYSEICTTIN